MNYWGLAVLIGALVVFGAWYGRDREAEDRMPQAGEEMMMEHENMESTQSHRSFEVRSQSATFTAGQAAPYRFSIVDDLGDIVKGFAVTHQKIMHVIVVRQDVTQFQHLHPEFDEASGVFTLPNLTFAEGGTYRIFADFSPLSAQKDAHGQMLSVTVFEDVKVKGAAKISGAIDTQKRLFAVNGYAFTLATTPTSPRSGETVRLRFTAQQGGRALFNLEPYLGALGHVVVLRQGDLEYLHTHPVTEKQASDGAIEFEVVFPTAGTYKIFGQFQHDGKVLTSEFGVAVEQGGEEGHEEGMGEMMDHMMSH